jgi:DNA-binding NtrC family response regulator
MKNQINIFIVEDDTTFAASLIAEIESSFDNVPFKIHSFETGERCMAQYDALKPKVVILNYYLNSNYPNAANGIEVLDWIKRKRQKTDVIMLTHEDDVEIAIKSFKHGASDYVVKSKTQFKKLNYSLFNLLKIMEAKKEALKYKYFLGIFLGLMGLLFGAIIAIQIYSPEVFNK